jgi:hypothetical protein
MNEYLVIGIRDIGELRVMILMGELWHKNSTT